MNVYCVVKQFVKLTLLLRQGFELFFWFDAKKTFNNFGINSICWGVWVVVAQQSQTKFPLSRAGYKDDQYEVHLRMICFLEWTHHFLKNKSNQIEIIPWNNVLSQCGISKSTKTGSGLFISTTKAQYKYSLFLRILPNTEYCTTFPCLLVS